MLQCDKVLPSLAASATSQAWYVRLVKASGRSVGGQGLAVSLSWRRHLDPELCGSTEKCWPFPQTEKWELLALMWGRKGASAWL